METVFETESYVATDAAWHQELTFDEPYKATVVIENLGSDPIYGFFLDEPDFKSMIETGEVDEAIMSRIQQQLICENETGTAAVEVEFPAGKHFVCLELDCESKPDAQRTEFRFSIRE